MTEHLVELELMFRTTDGSLAGAYLKLRDGKVHRTEEIEDEVLLADYDKDGRLLGLEVLAAIDMSLVVELVDDPAQKKAIKNIMQSRMRDLLAA